MNRFEAFSKRQKIAITSLFALIILVLGMVLLEILSFGGLALYRTFYTSDTVTFGWVKQVESQFGFFYHSPGPGPGELGNFAISDPYLGYRFQPSTRMDSYDKLTGEKTGYLQVNKYGFVKNNDDASDDEAIDPEDFIIVVTGGSTAAAVGLSNNSLTFSSILERRLNAYSPEGLVLRRPVRVINAGTPGYNSSQEIIYMVFDLIYLEPDIWVMFNGINERSLAGKLEGATNWHHNLLLVQRLNSSRRITMGGFLPLTRLVVERVTNRGKADNNDQDNQLVRPGYLNNALLLRRGSERYSKNIEIAASIAGSQGMRFIHALQPTSGAGNHAFTQREVAIRQSAWSEKRWQAYQQIADQFYDEFESEVGKLQLQSSNNNPVVVTNMRHIFDQVVETVYRDPVHYNGLGNRLIAEHLFNIITSGFAEELYVAARVP